MRRIVCIGNRYVPGDDAGFRVFERLAGRALPAGLEVLDGGLGGLALLALVDGAERVVFVDAAHGLPAAEGPVPLDPEALAATADPAHGHAAGLPYLLRVLAGACDAPPTVAVVGVPIAAVDDETTEAAAALALRLALEAP